MLGAGLGDGGGIVPRPVLEPGGQVGEGEERRTLDSGALEDVELRPEGTATQEEGGGKVIKVRRWIAGAIQELGEC